MFELRRMARMHSSLKGVDVQTVDMFQGEENDIVVLSLTRTKALTRFLRTRNRVNVAVSRARSAGRRV